MTEIVIPDRVRHDEKVDRVLHDEFYVAVTVNSSYRRMPVSTEASMTKTVIPDRVRHDEKVDRVRHDEDVVITNTK
jgi:hypothetical protein